MIGPKRFVASRGLKADLLRSARGDRPSQASRRRALVAAGAAAAATSSTSLAMGSSVARWAVWKWVAAGLASTVAVVTARTVLVPSSKGEQHPVAVVAPPEPPARVITGLGSANGVAAAAEEEPAPPSAPVACEPARGNGEADKAETPPRGPSRGA